MDIASTLWVKEILNMKIVKIAKATVVSAGYLASEVESLHHTYDDIIEGDVLGRIHQYESWQLVTYNIDDLNLDEFDTYEDLIEKYVKAIKVNSSYPPVIIDDKSYDIPTVVDGMHRLNALDRLGYKTVKAYVPV